MIVRGNEHGIRIKGAALKSEEPIKNTLHSHDRTRKSYVCVCGS